MLEFIKRMKTEKEILDKKIFKALSIIHPEMGITLDDKEKSMLDEQITYIQRYRDILEQRIDYEVKKHGY